MQRAKNVPIVDDEGSDFLCIEGDLVSNPDIEVGGG